MKKTNKVVLGLSCLLLLVLAGCGQDLKPAPVENLACSDPMVSVIMEQWGENINNTDQILWAVSILNYGLTEAKDVKIKCIVQDFDNEVLQFESFDAGNIASESYAYKEFTGFKDALEVTETYGYCYLESCSNCIDLDARIPEMNALRDE